MRNWRGAWWLPGGHAQTIWPTWWSYCGAMPAYRRQRWDSPDGDFIDVDVVAAPAPGPSRIQLVLFHGLEGSSASPYARAFAAVAANRGWDYAVVHFRGCSGSINRAPRAYHSGDYEEIDWILKRMASAHPGPSVAVGVSLGANALLRWAQEAGQQACQMVQAIAAVSAPLDLSACGQAIDSGVNRWLYARHFLRTMKPRAVQKWHQYPGLFDLHRLLGARTLYEFDDVFTAPLHGFRGTADYWRRAAARPHLQRLRLPTLILNATNDPFYPSQHLPGPAEVSPWVSLWQPRSGGHCGFAQGHPPGHVMDMPQAVVQWLAEHVSTTCG